MVMMMMMMVIRQPFPIWLEKKQVGWGTRLCEYDGSDAAADNEYGNACADAGNDGDADFADDDTDADAGVSSNDFSCFCWRWK